MFHVTLCTVQSCYKICYYNMSTFSPTFSLKTLIEHFMHSFFTGLQRVLTPCFTIVRAKNNNFSFHATERPKMWHFNDHRSGRKFINKNVLFYMPQKNTNNVLYNFKTKILFICCCDTHSPMNTHVQKDIDRKTTFSWHYR